MRRTIRVITILIALTLCFMTTVNAKTEEDIIAYVSGTFNVAGKEVVIPQIHVDKTKAFLEAHELTSEQVDKVLEKMEKAVKVMVDAGTIHLKDLNQSQREELLKLAEEAGEVVNAKVKYVAGEGIIATDESGRVYTITPEDPSSFVQTGNSYMIYTLAGVAIIAVAGIAIYRKIKVNA